MRFHKRYETHHVQFNDYEKENYDNNKMKRGRQTGKNLVKTIFFCSFICIVIVTIFRQLSINNSPSPPKQNLRNSGVKSCLVCITGQQSRLIEGNKTTLLFTPLKKHCNIDVVFVLAKTTNFVNENIMHDMNIPVNGDYIKVINNIRQFSMVTYVKTPEIPPYISNNTWQKHLSTMTYFGKNKYYKAKFHWNQINTIASCLPPKKKKYDIVIRLREDTVFENKVKFEHMLHDTKKSVVYFQKFDSWGGINDKMAVTNVEPRIFFQSQLNYWNAINKNTTLLSKKATNMEKFTAASFIWSGFELQPTNFFMGTPRSPWNVYVCNKYICKWRSEQTWQEKEWSYICITGQLGRLELDSKIDKLILPLTRKNDVIVKVVLSEGLPRFTNGFDGIHTYVNHTNSAYTIEEIRKKMHDIGVKQTIFISPFLNTSLAVHEKYVKALNKKERVLNDKTYNKRRERNHKRQYETIHSCKIRENDGVLYKNRPRYTFRIREDAFILNMDVDKMLREIDKIKLNAKQMIMGSKIRYKSTRRKTYVNSIITQKCAAWHGLNDKFAMVPGYSSKDLFEAPLNLFKSGILPKDIPRWGLNPEIFYKASYSIKNFTLIPTSSFTIVTCRYIDSKADCVPRGVALCEKTALDIIKHMNH